MASLSEIQQQLAALRQSYAQQLLGKIEQIQAIWEQLQQNWDDKTLATFHRMTHNLAGSGATFGFTGLSDRAHSLERFLKTMMQEGNVLTAEGKVQIQALLLLVEEAATEPDIDSSINQLDNYILAQTSKPVLENNRLIYLVKDDPDLAQDLMLQISYFGYSVRSFQKLADLEQAVQRFPPAAIIIDVVPQAEEPWDLEILHLIQHSLETPVPIMFLAVKGDLSSRLQAVRAGGYAYFTKPVEVGALIDKLDMLTAHQTPDPYRILIVDDDKSLASYYAFTLQQAGMVTEVVSEPMKVMQPLVEFRPELILMDVYMPHCSGAELAIVIRQMESYVSIPIVFLSRETNVDEQLKAMSLGADDFLMKPIHPDHLIQSVSTRVQRSRLLRSFMIQDSLTGLLNHTKTKEQLVIELSRTQRQQAPLSFAMIDIDNFKSVNDTYGHAIGDRVIKSLARLLQQRLRKSDVIGRYGGEEFAVILPETDCLGAKRVLDELRNGFAQIRHQAGSREFAVTFSCGVADYPTYRDHSSLSDAADRALYAAKQRGRNQIQLANYAPGEPSE